MAEVKGQNGRDESRMAEVRAGMAEMRLGCRSKGQQLKRRMGWQRLGPGCKGEDASPFCAQCFLIFRAVM